MAIQENDFNFICDFVKKEAAIVLESGKEYLVESRLSPIIKEAGLEDIAALVKEVQRNASSILRPKIVEALTTNETSFFRDVKPFDVLKKHVFPDLLEKRNKEKSLSMWCAASSTGQEPYSVAMVLRENFPEIAKWKLNFLATDLSDDVLEKAKGGVYTQLEVNRGLPATSLIRWFKKQENNWILSEDIKNMVRFEKLNLLSSYSTLPPCDLVFIRNVLIYFDVETKSEILSKIRGLLKSDGYLFLGAAESTLNVDDHFERCNFDGGGGGSYRLK